VRRLNLFILIYILIYFNQVISSKDVTEMLLLMKTCSIKT